MNRVTVKMTQAAIKQLVVDGVLPKHAPMDVYEKHWESVEKALTKAIELIDEPDYNECNDVLRS